MFLNSMIIFIFKGCRERLPTTSISTIQKGVSRTSFVYTTCTTLRSNGVVENLAGVMNCFNSGRSPPLREVNIYEIICKVTLTCSPHSTQYKSLLSQRDYQPLSIELIASFNLGFSLTTANVNDTFNKSRVKQDPLCHGTLCKLR